MCKINDVPVDCFIDLGSDCSLIRYGEAQVLGLDLNNKYLNSV